MHADLQNLIRLQKIDSAAADAERRLADESARQQAFDARLEAARSLVAAAKAGLADNQNARRAVEKDVAVHQGRLSKFRDQLMAVKTNQEYQAMQKEIEFAQAEVRALEDRILELMLSADELTSQVKRAEAGLATEQKAVDADRRAMDAEFADLRGSLERLAADRATIVAALDRQTLAIYDTIVKRRNGIGVAEARDGICTICHVRLRPQVFNTVRRNDQILQCDSCNRILYFVPAPVPVAADGASQPAQ